MKVVKEVGRSKAANKVVARTAALFWGHMKMNLGASGGFFASLQFKTEKTETVKLQEAKCSRLRKALNATSALVPAAIAGFVLTQDADAVSFDRDDTRELVDQGRQLLRALNAESWEIDPITQALQVEFDDGWRGVFDAGEYLIEGNAVFLWPENIFVQAYPVQAVWNLMWGHPAAAMAGGGLWWLLGKNQAPVAVGDALAFTEGDKQGDNEATLSFNVLGDDSDPNNDAISLLSFEDVTGNFGRFTMNAAGTDIEYHFLDDINATNLAEGETGTDTARYQIQDEHGLTDTATLTVTVTGINKAVEDDDEPSAYPAVGDVSEDDSSVTLTNLLDNASDADGADPFISAVAGGVVGQRVDMDAGGYFILNANGTAAFHLDGDFEELDKDDTATVSIDYTVSDGRGSTTSSTVTVTVIGKNDGFTDGDESKTVNEDAKSSLGNILSVTDDPDEDDSHSITDVGDSDSLEFSPSTGGTLTVTANGAATFDPEDDFDDLAAGESRKVEIEYEVSDSSGNGADQKTDTSTLSITVQGRNDPFTDKNETLIVSEDASSAGSVEILNADDPDTNDKHTIKTFMGVAVPAAGLTLSSTSTPAIAGGTLTVSQSGTVTFDPEGDFDELLLKDSKLTFDYEVTDNAATSSHTDKSTLTINISAVNDAIEDGDESFSTTENRQITNSNSANVLSNATDIDTGDTKHVSVDGTALTGSESESYDGDKGGSFTLTADGAMTFDPGTDFDKLQAGATTDTSFEYQVTDGDSTDTSKVTVKITGVNDAPNAVDDGMTFTVAGTTSTKAFEVIGDDTDVDGGTISLTGLTTINSTFGNFAKTTDNKDVEYTFYGTSTDSRALAKGQTAKDTASYTISDGQGATDTGSITVKITGVNDAPSAKDLTESFDEGGGKTSYTFDVMGSATDIDSDVTVANKDDKLTITLVGDTTATSHGTFALTTDEHKISYTFADGDSLDNLDTGSKTTESIKYKVTDQHGATAEKTITVTINGLTDNTDPVAKDISLSFTEDTAKTTTFDVPSNISDVDGDSLNVSTFAAKTGTYGTFSQTASGDIQYAFANDSEAQKLKKGDVKTETATYSISDGNGGTDAGTLKVTITGVNDAPTASDLTGAMTENAAKSISLDVVGASSDVDEDAVISALSIDTTGSQGNFTLGSDGSVSYSLGSSADFDYLEAGKTAKDTAQFTVEDQYGETASATMTVKITGVNDAPVVKTKGNDIAFQDGGSASDANFLVPLVNGGYSDTLGQGLALEFSDVDDSSLDEVVTVTPDSDNADQNHIPTWGFDPTNGALTGTANLADPTKAEKYTVKVTATDDGNNDAPDFTNPLTANDSLDVYIGLNLSDDSGIEAYTSYTLVGSPVAQDIIQLETFDLDYFGANESPNDEVSVTIDLGQGLNTFHTNFYAASNGGELIYTGGDDVDDLFIRQGAAQDGGKITLDAGNGQNELYLGFYAARNGGELSYTGGTGVDLIDINKEAAQNGGKVTFDLGNDEAADVIAFWKSAGNDDGTVIIQNFDAGGSGVEPEDTMIFEEIETVNGITITQESDDHVRIESADPFIRLIVEDANAGDFDVSLSGGELLIN